MLRCCEVANVWKSAAGSPSCGSRIKRLLCGTSLPVSSFHAGALRGLCWRGSEHRSATLRLVERASFVAVDVVELCGDHTGDDARHRVCGCRSCHTSMYSPPLPEYFCPWACGRLSRERWWPSSNSGPPFRKPAPRVYVLVATLGAALALLGTGAWSVDARLFGWKRIDLSEHRH